MSRRACVVAVTLLAACQSAASSGGGITITDLGPRLSVQSRGQAFAEYRRDSGRRPVLWPLHAPGGQTVTRAFPFADVVGEPKDHPAQESLCLGFSNVGGIDFADGPGRIVLQELAVDDGKGELRGVASWQSEGREICRDFHRIAFADRGDRRSIDIDLTMVASDGELVLSGSGPLLLRLRPELALRGGAATLVDSDGRRDGAVFGQRARWLACSGAVGGEPMTVAVFAHPQNPGAPAAWQARDYGFVAACAVAADGPALRVPAGGQLRLRYRVMLVRGRPSPIELETEWQRFSAP